MKLVNIRFDVHADLDVDTSRDIGAALDVLLEHRLWATLHKGLNTRIIKLLEAREQ
jgi:hypothetical protein